MSAAVVLGSTIGQIFQPLFQAMAWLMAFFYHLVPNYAIAIALLTILVMAVTAPLTVKSTRSMVAMQRLAPELKKLQAKYKGDKQTLNEEMMKLYREHGVNPAGGCLPLLVQFPIFIILYDVIRGLTNTVKTGAYFQLPSGHWEKCLHGPCASPRYIGHTTSLYASLLQHNGKMPAFGIDLSARVLGHHSLVAAIPYAVLILLAIALQYLQMWQLNSRNPQAAQANPQMQMMQKYMPLIFAVIYINIPAGVNIYFIVSNLCRIAIQEGVFRAGLVSRPSGKPAEETLPARGGTRAPRRRTLMERLADAQKRAFEQQEQQRQRRAGPDAGSGGGSGGAGSSGPATKSGKDASSSVRPKQAPAVGSGEPQGRRGAQSGSGARQHPNGSQPKRSGQTGSKAKRGRRSR